MKHTKRRWKVFLTAFGLSALFSLLLAFLLVNIIERKGESRNPFYRVVSIDEQTEDPAVWGQNFPLQYDGYLKTADQVRTRYGGSEAMPRTPTKADPRSIVARSRLEEDPRLKTIWDGYAFSKDFRERRGHAYMLVDQTFTERQQFAQQPGTCLHCHASIYVPYMKAGGGNLIHGFEIMNQMPYQEARTHVTHPVACIDCHNPKTMQLRITRPAFIEGIAKVKKLEGINNYDVNQMATRMEMRTYVCAQCHDEYYFKGKEKRLTYPWELGLKIENIYDYYKREQFKDWTHKTAGSPLLKAQHPEFETWSQGIHARSGVTCADCHMPYQREGAMKITDHHVRSPLLNINHACQTCHRWPESELKARVEQIQETTFNLRNRAMEAVVALVHDITEAKKSGITDTALAGAQEDHRRSQFYLDFMESENSTGFHAPQEAARILGEAIDYARQGQLKVLKLQKSK